MSQEGHLLSNSQPPPKLHPHDRGTVNQRNRLASHGDDLICNNVKELSCWMPLTSKTILATSLFVCCMWSVSRWREAHSHCAVLSYHAKDKADSQQAANTSSIAAQAKYLRILLQAMMILLKRIYLLTTWSTSTQTEWRETRGMRYMYYSAGGGGLQRGLMTDPIPIGFIPLSEKKLNKIK